MYFRYKFTRKVKVAQLVESFRDSEGRPRQRIVVSLGDAPFPQTLWKIVADEIQNRLQGIDTFLDITSAEEQWIGRILKEIEKKKLSTANPSALLKPAIPIVESNKEKLTSQDAKPTLIQVDPGKISHQHTTELGPELVIMHAWKVLQVDSLLKSLGFGDRHVDLALLSVANRLVDPQSEHALPSWVETTSFQNNRCFIWNLIRKMLLKIKKKLIIE